MSQKSSRRQRRQTHDEEVVPKPATKKTPVSVPIVEEAPPIATVEEPPTNGKAESNGTEKKIEESEPKPVETEPAPKESEQKAEELPPVVVLEVQENVEDEQNGKDVETDMDPLILFDDPDPELVFEDGSDEESVKGSPVVSRCKTRRSGSRNIPTPKSPKSLNEDPSPVPVLEQDLVSVDLNNSFESCSENLSTNAQAGSDATRLEYMDKDTYSLESNSFLSATKNKSFGESLRMLSARRSIRPLTGDYRKRVLQSNMDKKDFNVTYQTRQSVDRLSVSGLKRQQHSDSEESEAKRFKGETSPGFFSRISSPFASIKNTFRSDLPSSTPKLTGYKDDKFLLEDGGKTSEMCEIKNPERNWCSIM